MPEPVRSSSVQSDSNRLDSWKDIAGYLGREVRTVQGWEKNEGLPIHRHQHARQGTVYAFKSELDAWRKQRASSPEPAAPVEPVDAPEPVGTSFGKVAAIVAVALFAAGGLIAWNRYNTATSSVSSVVVLPFVDMSPGKDQEYFSDGLTEEIIDALSRAPKMRVVARTSAFEFKGKNTDIREIGKRLNASAVLEGSVRKSEDQVRITAQLNRASDGFHLWSRTFDRPMRDIFALQREISQSIANQLGGGQVSQREPTKDLEAYRLYQEGRYFFNKFDLQDSNVRAIERFQQAIARDPKFALAYAGMADAYAYQAENMLVSPKDVMPKAKEAAEKAVALDPNLGEGHTSLGIVKLDYEWDIVGADREFRRAIELIPGSGYANHWLGHAFEAELRLNEAIVQFRKGIELDPLSPPAYWDLAGDLVSAKRFDEARSVIRTARANFPENPMFPVDEIADEMLMGNISGARKLRNEWKPPAAMEGTPPLIGMDAMLAGMEGNLEAPRKALTQFEELRKKRFIPSIPIIQLCHVIKDRACVMTWLTRAYDDHAIDFVYVRAYYPYVISGIPEAEAFVDKVLRGK